MANGYGAGLFDDSGPKAFASAVGGISSELKSVQSAFSSFGSAAQSSLSGVAGAVQDLISKLSEVRQQLQQGFGAPGPGGGGGGGARPTMTGAGGGSGNTGANVNAQGWSPDAVPSPGYGGLTQGTPSLPLGTADKGPTQFPDQPQGTATPTPTASQTGGGGGLAGMLLGSASGSTTGQRAVQSMIPAAVGAVSNQTATAIQGATIGQITAPAFGVSSRSLYVMPSGTLAQNQADYAQANYYAMTQMNIAPGTANWSTFQRGNNQLMRLLPGETRQGAAAAQNQMQQNSTLNAALMFGMNFRPGGQLQDPEKNYGQILQTMFPNGKPTGQQFESYMQAYGQQNLSALGITPGSDAYSGFMQYAISTIGMKGNGLLPDVGTAAGAKQTPLGNNPYSAQLNRQSEQSRIKSQAEPDLAEASKILNEAATKLLGFADPLASLLGGGGPGGMLGQALGLGGMLLGGKVLGKVGGKVLGKVGGKVLGGIAGKVAGKGGLLGRLGGLFGGGGGEAAAAGGEEVAAAGGLEAAGAAADATGIGLPVGLALGAAGLAVGFHKQIGEAIGGVGHWIGGLFGGHKKKTTDDPSGGSANDVMALLTDKPPVNSLLDCLTKPIPKGTTTALTLLLSGAGSGSGTGTSSTQAMQAGSVWNSTQQNMGPVDLSAMFATPTKAGGSGGGSGGGNSGGSGGTGAGGTGSSGGAGSKSGAPTGNLASWIAKAMQLTGVSGTDWTNGLNLIIQHESGGNPNAVNNWDSNAAAGHPSQGLMQEIPSTFQSNALPGYNKNILDPVSNIAAGIKYIQTRYHGINNVPGVKAVASGGSYVGYARGSQLIDRTQLALLHKGEAVVPAADNYSTRPYNRGGASNGGGGTMAVTLNFKAGAVVLQVPASASQQDMEKMAQQFVAAVSKPAILAGIRST